MRDNMSDFYSTKRNENGRFSNFHSTSIAKSGNFDSTKSHKTALSLKHVSLSYPDKALLKDLSLSLEFGEILCVLGNNGIGKSSLARLITGEISKDRSGIIKQGKFRAFGSIGYMRQNFFSSYAYPCLDIVLMGLGKSVKLFSRPKKSDEKRALKILEHLGILNLAYINFSDLSGGQKQLVLIARLLIGNYDILILDEVTSALDFSYTKIILQLILELRREGKAIIYITHQVQQAFILEAKILLLQDTTALLTDYKSITKEELAGAFGVEFGYMKEARRLEKSGMIVPKF